MDLNLSENSNSGEEESKSQPANSSPKSSPTHEQELLLLLTNPNGGDKRIYDLIAELLSPSNDEIVSTFNPDLLVHLSRTNTDAVSYFCPKSLLRPHQTFLKIKNEAWYLKVCPVRILYVK